MASRAKKTKLVYETRNFNDASTLKYLYYRTNYAFFETNVSVVHV